MRRKLGKRGKKDKIKRQKGSKVKREIGSKYRQFPCNYFGKLFEIGQD